MTRASISEMHAVLPPMIRSATEIDRWIGEPDGWVARTTGVESRHVAASDVSVSEFGAQAVRELLQRSEYSLCDIDALVFASGSKDQFLPASAALVAHQLGEEAAGIPAFDIDSTCLSFVLALDLMSRAMSTGMYRRIVLLSAELPSRGLTPERKETAGLFGDAAIAAILEVEPVNAEPVLRHIGHAKFETYGEGAHHTEVRVGASKSPIFNDYGYRPEDFAFLMDGPKVYELAARELPGFLDRFLRGAGMELADFDFVIPHQASKSAVELFARRLGVPRGRYAQDYRRFGNTVAASIPLSYLTARNEGIINPGDHVLFLGTAAGLTLGAMAVEV